MKKSIFVTTILGVAGLVALCTLAPSSAGRTQGQGAQPMATQGAMHGHENPYEGLNLTDDQKAQIKKIHEDAKAKAEAVKADASLSEADKQAKIKEIHHAAMMESDKLLTPEQRAQMKDKMKEHKAEKPQS